MLNDQMLIRGVSSCMLNTAKLLVSEKAVNCFCILTSIFLPSSFLQTKIFC